MDEIHRGTLVAPTSQTNQQIITEPFIKLGLVAEGHQPSATQSAQGLTILNDNMLTQMMDGWRDIGWYPQTTANLTTPAPLQDSDVADIKLALAAWIAPHYGKTVDPPTSPADKSSLGAQVEAAFTRLDKRYLRRTEADLGELSRPQGGPWGGPNWL
jgi:hypothetical protein